ncbi:MAG: hypothetical protein ABIW46_08820 [Acidimicrobiales bacterium]
MAIFVSLVLVGAAFPLAGLGYSTYVRGATAAELQRAADSGALAGATAIPLADLTALNAYRAAVGVKIRRLPSSPPDDPRVIACNQSVRAAQVDDGFSQHYATPTPNGTTSPDCTAEYTPDLGVLGGITSCVNGIVNFVPLTGLPLVLGPLGLLVPRLVGGLLTVLQTNTLLANLENLLPALLRPGIKTILTFDVRGPLDALNPADDGTAKVQTVSATARRRFKNLVVLPTTTLPLTTDPIPLNAAVGAVAQTSIDTLFALNTSIGGVLGDLGISGCGNLIGALATDLEDLINPPADADAPTVEQVLQAAVDDVDPVLLLVIPTNVTSALAIPFLDFLPVCVEKVGGTFRGLAKNLPAASGCLTNAPGAFRGTLVK